MIFFFLRTQFFMLGIEFSVLNLGASAGAALPPTCYVVSGKDLDLLCPSFLLCKMGMMSSLQPSKGFLEIR